MSREIMQQALSAFEAILFEKNIEATQIIARNARYSLREALAQPEQGLVCDRDPFYCWSIRCQVGKVCKHTAPPKPWVGLTGLELNHIYAANVGYPERMCRAIEAKLKEKDNGNNT